MKQQGYISKIVLNIKRRTHAVDTINFHLSCKTCQRKLYAIFDRYTCRECVTKTWTRRIHNSIKMIWGKRRGSETWQEQKGGLSFSVTFSSHPKKSEANMTKYYHLLNQVGVSFITFSNLFYLYLNILIIKIIINRIHLNVKP